MGDPRAVKVHAVATCLIGGESVVATGAVTDVISPYWETAIGGVAEAGPALVGEAVDSARESFRGWSDTPLEERACVLDRVAQLVERAGDTLAGLVSDEMGMPITLARATQVDLPATVLRATAQTARDMSWEEPVPGAVLDYRAAGVVGAVTPWNMPVHQIVAKVAGALVSGCTVVLKASEQTPYDADLLGRLFLEAGLPPGAFNIVTGRAETGAALCGNPDVSRVSFTGSVPAGRAVAGLAAANLVPCTLELGGKSAAVVLPDADLDIVLPRILQSGLVNSGQACNATTRLLIPESLADEVEARIPSLVSAMVMGDPADEATNFGPLVSRVQRDRVLDHINDAIAAGGRLVTGTGKPSDVSDHGWFVDPTVVAGLPHTARTVQEEIFGPVLVLQPYGTLDEAVALANGTKFGLSAEVWSADHESAVALARQLRAGQVKVNGVRTRERPNVPFGGIGDSGYGRELGHLGILDFCDVRAVMA
jgi:aldehyde dehydrogenase (NAD+)